jgi:hypothetical protein
MELADGQQVTLSQLQSKGFTYQGKPVEFKQVEDNPFVYEAKTKLTDEQLAAGNNDVTFIFSFSEAVGNVVKIVNELSEEDRTAVEKKVKDAKDKPEKEQEPPAPAPAPAPEIASQKVNTTTAAASKGK